MSFLSGLKNCHLRGIDSLVIRNRESDERGMVRVFYNRDCSDMARLRNDDGSYVLAPHNHRQDITLYPVWGAVVNMAFKVDRRSHDHYHTEFRFDSAIVDGKIKVRYKDCVDLYLKNAGTVTAASVHMPWSEVHTVLSEPDSAWLVIEGRLAPDGSQSLCYSPTKNGILEFDQTDMYQEMTTEEIQGMDLLYSDSVRALAKIKA